MGLVIKTRVFFPRVTERVTEVNLNKSLFLTKYSIYIKTLAGNWLKFGFKGAPYNDNLS